MQNIKKNLMRKYIFQQYYLVTYYKLTNACSKKNVFSEGNILCEELFNYISGDQAGFFFPLKKEIRT